MSSIQNTKLINKDAQNNKEMIKNKRKESKTGKDVVSKEKKEIKENVENNLKENGNNLNEENIEQDEETSLNQPSVRNILGFIDKYDRVEVQELLSQMNCNWLLSLEDFKLPTEHPSGLISQMTQLSEDHIFILLPYDPSIKELDYREIHQILRELTIGMYVLNQHPYLQLEANFDESTSCQMPVKR